MENVQVFVAPGTKQHIAQDLGRVASRVRFSTSPSEASVARQGLVILRLADMSAHHEVRGEWFGLARKVCSRLPVLLCGIDSEKVSLSGALARAIASFAAWTRAVPYVIPDADSLRRMVLARTAHAERSLIASVLVEGRGISVWSCEPRLYELSADEIPSLASLSTEELGSFEVSESGSRVHWPSGDVDLDLDAFRWVVDPEFKRECVELFRRESTRYGHALRSFREGRGVLQGKIAGVTEREVRRLEKGETIPRVETLEALARAFGMTLKEYMAELASVSKKKRR